MHISVKSPRCFFPGKVWDLWLGYNGWIQRKDRGGRVTAGSTSPKTLKSTKTYHVTLPSLFWFTQLKSETSLPSLLFQLFSFVRIWSHGDNKTDPRQEALVFRTDLTVN